MYWGRKKSTYKIAEKYGVSDETIRNWLIKLGIPRRSRSEANRVKAIRKHWRKKFFVDWWKEPTWNLGYVVGAVIGDGTLTKYGFAIASTCKEWLQNVSKIILYWCGWYPIFKERKFKTRYMTKSKGLVEKTKTLYEIGLWSIDVARFIREVIEKIEEYLVGVEFFGGFLSGLIDSDGSIIFYRRSTSITRLIRVYNTNYKLLKDVSIKLKVFGVASKVITVDSKRKTPEYALSIHGKENFAKLKEIINLQHPKKRENLNKIIASYGL